MAMTKQAWFNKETLKKTVTNPYFQAAALPVVGLGMDAALDQVREVVRARGKAQAYKAMLKESPQLSKKPSTRTQRYFNTLYNANPDLAKDPLVASSWVNTQLEQEIPGHPHAGIVSGISDVVKIRQMAREPSSNRGGPFRQMGESLGKNVSDIHKAGIGRRKNELEQQQQYLDRTADALSNRMKLIGQKEMELQERAHALQQKK